MPAHQQDKRAAEVDREQRHQDCRDNTPDNEGVPLPLPDVVEETQRMVAEVLELAAIHRQAAGVEEVDAELDERDKQEQMQRRGGMGAYLGGDLVEAEGPGEHDDQQRGEAYGRVDSDNDAQSEAPGEPARRNPATQETEQRAQNPAAEELANSFRDEHIRV